MGQQQVRRFFADYNKINDFFTSEGEDFGAIASSEVTFTTDNRIKRLAIPIVASNSTKTSEWFTITLDEVILIHASNKTPLNLTDEERARLMHAESKDSKCHNLG